MRFNKRLRAWIRCAPRPWAAVVPAYEAFTAPSSAVLAAASSVLMIGAACFCRMFSATLSSGGRPEIHRRSWTFVHSRYAIWSTLHATAL